VAYQNKFWRERDDSLYVSLNGLVWTKVIEKLPIDDVESLTMFKGKLWLFDNGESWSSSNGIDWQLQTEGELFGLAPYQEVFTHTLADQIYVITAKGTTEEGLWRSPDGITWSFVELGKTDPLINTQTVFDNKLWSFKEGKVSYTENGGKWTEIDALPHSDFDLVTFNNELWAYGTHQDISFDTRVAFKLNADYSWQLVTDNLPIGRSSYSSNSQFIEKNNLLYYVSNFDPTGHTSGVIWRSKNGVDWQKGAGYKINF